MPEMASASDSTAATVSALGPMEILEDEDERLPGPGSLTEPEDRVRDLHRWDRLDLGRLLDQARQERTQRALVHPQPVIVEAGAGPHEGEAQLAQRAKCECRRRGGAARRPCRYRWSPGQGPTSPAPPRR